MTTLLAPDDLPKKGIKYSRGHLHRLVKAGKFPKPVKVGENRNAFVEKEIDEYIEARIAARDQEAA